MIATYKITSWIRSSHIKSINHQRPLGTALQSLGVVPGCHVVQALQRFGQQRYYASHLLQLLKELCRHQRGTSGTSCCWATAMVVRDRAGDPHSSRKEIERMLKKLVDELEKRQYDKCSRAEHPKVTTRLVHLHCKWDNPGSKQAYGRFSLLSGMIIHVDSKLDVGQGSKRCWWCYCDVNWNPGDGCFPQPECNQRSRINHTYLSWIGYS